MTRSQSLLKRLALALAALTAPAAAQPPASSAPPPPASQEPALPLPDLGTDDLQLGADSSDHMTLPVEIGGVGPYAFIIDTGSQRSIIATELAQRLALPMLPPVKIITIAGHETVASVHLDHLKFGTQLVTDMPVLSIAHANLGSAGLIGLDGLKDKRVTLDFRARKLQISSSLSARHTRAPADTIIVEARSKFGQLILVGSKIDGRRVSVILDTGAEISIGNMALFNRLKVKRLLIPPRPTTITSVTGESIPALLTIVRQVDIETMTLNNVPMVFLDAAPFEQLGLIDRPAMLLGMQMLRMFDRVAIDFGNRKVDFQLPRGSGGPHSAPEALAGLWD